MDYVKKFLHVEGIIGQGAFGRVLATSPLQNTIQSPSNQHLQQQQIRHLSEVNNRSQSLQTPGGTLNNLGHLSHHQSEEDAHLASPGQIKRNSLCNNSDQVARRFALKCVHPILKPQKLASELRHLRDLGGLHNVVQLHTAYFNKGSLYIVMELIEHDRFMDIVAHLEYEEIVMYMENLLDALEHVHSHNIMHRDIKPANFLFNRKNKKFLLIDFGLAQVVRTRAGLFNNCSNRVTSMQATPQVANNFTLPLSNTPTTPTSTQSRRKITTLTPDLIIQRRDNLTKRNNLLNETNRSLNNTNNNLNSSNRLIQQSPARLFKLTSTGSPIATNVGTKRHLTEATDAYVQQMKKLRVSTKDEIREPVKLTVGAYESPITNGDGSGKRNNKSKNHNFSTPKIPSKRNSSAKCDGRDKPKTCTICQTKPDSVASRSGTPGFKAPEIFLRYTHQTTAVDIWSAGVIFACLLSGHSPFFRDADDNTSLAEIITLLGSERVIQAAKEMSISLLVEPKKEPVDLMQLCKTIRLNNKDKRQIDIPVEAFDLLKKMLDPNPLTRITAREALREHAWLKQHHSSELSRD